MRFVAIKFLVVLALAACGGCALEVKPFEAGAETLPPQGCAVVRERGGRC